jgi:hypothetical protein
MQNSRYSRRGKIPQKGNNSSGRRSVERIAAERSEIACQNSFLIPTSQKVAEPRVLSGVKLMNLATRTCRLFGGAFLLQKSDAKLVLGSLA